MDLNVKLVSWECDEKIIEVNGQPIGNTLSKENGEQVERWLKANIAELFNTFAKDKEDK